MATTSRTNRAEPKRSAAPAPVRNAARRPADGMPRIDLDRATCSHFGVAVEREWLQTNGLGGYAAGTIAGAATRRYHGLLVAALDPPLGRTVLVASLDTQAEYQGLTHGLSTQEYAGGTVHPDGWRYHESFMLNGGIPQWTFAIGDARLTQSVWMGQGANTTYVRFHLESASGPLRLRLAPLCTYRDYHAHSRGGWQLGTTLVPDGIRVDAFPGARPYRLLCAEATCELRGDWFWNFHHRLEAERGLDSTEDLFRPGEFLIDLEVGGTATLICTAEPGAVDAPSAALSADQRRRAALLQPVAREPGWVRQLALAADQFIVARGSGAGQGATVIAGYPWFGDWGRDTMIALPGLTLPTGRPEVAARILRTFAEHLSEGMLPNRFPDGGAAPEYNTVDATLWYFHAVEAYLQATGDDGPRARTVAPADRDHRLAPARHAIRHWCRSCRRPAARGRAGRAAHLDGRQGWRLGGHPAHRQARGNQRPVASRADRDGEARRTAWRMRRSPGVMRVSPPGSWTPSASASGTPKVAISTTSWTGRTATTRRCGRTRSLRCRCRRTCSTPSRPPRSSRPASANF